MALPAGSDGKESVCIAGDSGLIPGLGRFPWRREWLPTLLFLPGKLQGQRSLAGYSPWGCKELDTTETDTFTLIMESCTPLCLAPLLLLGFSDTIVNIFFISYSDCLQLAKEVFLFYILTLSPLILLNLLLSSSSCYIDSLGFPSKLLHYL